MENENIDVRMSNFLAILSNQELCRKFDPSVVRNMESAVAIYAATTSKKYVENFNKERRAMETEEKVNSMFR